MSTQDISLRELLEAGAHFGHQSRRWNPKMKPYIYQSRDNIHVIDLTLTASGLKDACSYLRDLSAAGGVVLFIATKRQAKELVRQYAKEAGIPFVTERWVGGMLTNWDTILKNIQRYKDYVKQRETGELDKYTKKEQSLINKETERLEKIYEGLLDLNKIPDAVFVVDVRKEKIAVREASRRGIPVLGVCDTNCDPTLVDIVIPANDDALKSVEYLVSKITQAVTEGKRSVGSESGKDKEAAPEEKPAPKAKVKKEETAADDEKPKKRTKKAAEDK
jgi:small subunit ribosomal protein S2